MIGEPAVFGIITISDRASSGEYEDEGGPAIIGFFQEAVRSPWTHHHRIISDDADVIAATIIDMVDNLSCDVVVTTGGTGPGKRDVTPEATEAACERMMPGFGEQMRMISLQYTPTAILSRQVGGIRGKSLIFNLPGRPKAIRETIDEIWRAVPYCIDIMGGPYMVMDKSICDDFRPKNARRSE